MNMDAFILNQVLLRDEEDLKVDQVLFRRLIHTVNKYVWEIWSLSGGKVAVFSGKFDNQWNPYDIVFHGVFPDLEIAKNSTRPEVSDEAESPDKLF